MLSEFPSGFFTGDYTNCSWDSTANASASQYNSNTVLNSTVPPYEDIDQGTFFVRFRISRTAKNLDPEEYLFTYDNFVVQINASEQILIAELTTPYTAFLSSVFTFSKFYICLLNFGMCLCGRLLCR